MKSLAPTTVSSTQQHVVNNSKARIPTVGGMPLAARFISYADTCFEEDESLYESYDTTSATGR